MMDQNFKFLSGGFLHTISFHILACDPLKKVISICCGLRVSISCDQCNPKVSFSSQIVLKGYFTERKAEIGEK